MRKSHSGTGTSRPSQGVECVVPDCGNTFYETDGRTPTGNHFFKFRQYEPAKSRWLNLIKRREGTSDFKQVTVSTVICHVHFKPDVIMKGFGGQWRLTDTAEPTIFPLRVVTPSALPRSSRTSSGLRCDILPAPLNRPASTNTMEPCTNLNLDVNTKATSTFNLPQEHNSELTSSNSENVIMNLQRDLNNLKQQLDQSKEQCEKSKFRVHNMSDSQVNRYTGFPTRHRFELFFRFLDAGDEAEMVVPYHQAQQSSGGASVSADHLGHDHQYMGTENSRARKHILNGRNQLFLTLVRLRRGFDGAHLAYLFNISQQTASRYFLTWINFLYLKLGSLNIWPTKEQISVNVPQTVKERHPALRCIIDCTEIFTETPESLKASSSLFSQYKHHVTLKGLLGIAPSGGITFVSQLYPGSVSDREITIRSGFLNPKLWSVGDEVMADRGFTINDLLEPMGVKLTIPDFMKGRSQLSDSEVSNTQQVANIRIHVERAIQKVKCFHIFDSAIPISIFGSINQIWTVACLLTNHFDPIISVR